MRLICALCLLVLPASARPLTSQETADLGSRIDGFVQALGAGDVGAMLEILPPRLLDRLAEEAGVSVEEMIAVMEAETEAVLSDMSVSDIETARDGLDATDAEIGGADITWTLVPTSFDVDTGEMVVTFESSLLALREGEAWYLVRVAEPEQIGILRELYPPLEDVTFPETTSRVAE